MTYSEPVNQDDVTLENMERRKRMKREDRAFVAQLRAAILFGFETPAGVLGHQYGPRRPRPGTEKVAQSAWEKLAVAPGGLRRGKRDNVIADLLGIWPRCSTG
jgi:hypothetical protein